MDKLIDLPHVQAVMEEMAIAIRNEYQDNLIRNDRIAKGDLLNDVEFEIVKGDYTYSIYIKMKDYWYYVENGRKAGKMPPIARKEGEATPEVTILDWVIAKPILPRPNSKGKLPTPKQLAFLIARKIGKLGTEGTHDLRKATDSIWDTFEEKLYEAIDKDLDTALVSIFHYM